ncbi:F-box/WD repeat-containing protein [Parendozoicomonas haliclonae]|uniref:F-box/WD repeat-containing protein n=1 Tax=Parendozoicomonas haliclonae TaxID=1960125 RepID=UPI00105553B5|nr:F-box protein [Parendozoicomonas haliclonae]
MKCHQVSRSEQDIQHGIECRPLQPASHRFQGFPVETLDRIARYLPYHELLTFSQVSRTCYQIASCYLDSGVAFARSDIGNRLPLCYQPEYFSFTVSPWLQAVNPEEADRLESCKTLPHFSEALNLSVANTIAGFSALQLYLIAQKQHMSAQENQYPLMSPDGAHIALCNDIVAHKEEIRMYHIGGIMKPRQEVTLPLIPRISRRYFSENSHSFTAETMKDGIYISKLDEEGNWGHYQRQTLNKQDAPGCTLHNDPDGCPDCETQMLRDNYERGLPIISAAVRLALSPNNQHMVAEYPSTFKLFSRHLSGQWVQSFDASSLKRKFRSAMWALEEIYSPDGRHLVFRFPNDMQSYFSPKQAPILSWNQKKMVWESSGTLHCNGFISHVSFSPNSILLGVTSADKNLQIYGRGSGGIWQKKGQYHFAERVLHVAFTKDNFHIIVTGMTRMRYLTIGRKSTRRHHPYEGKLSSEQLR